LAIGYCLLPRELVSDMSFVTGLRCRECGRSYPKEALFVCEYCFGPLEVVYDYEAVRTKMSREAISRRPANLWRYRELLPIESEPTDGLYSGFTPLVRAHHLGAELGIEELWIKDDSVNHPTLSYKDRVVPVALSRAKELGFTTVGCATTGNLGHAVAAHGAMAGLRVFILMPAGLEMGKIVATAVYSPRVIAVEGTYDEVNRLCTEISSKYRWAFVNVNLRPYYTEGAKTAAFEICEQLGWQAPDHIVIPVAGATLLPKVWKGLKELHLLGLIPSLPTRIYAAQASGCAPVVNAMKEGSDIIRPVKPDTIAKSLAIGNPADGYYALKTIAESKGWGEAVSDEEIIEGMRLLARTEGIFTETAGGVTVAATRKLVETARLPRQGRTVICITGSGLKTQEAVMGRLGSAVTIRPSLASFEEQVKNIGES